MDLLPDHLKKYVVQQNYEKYTPVDQAVWRFILRQLRAYLSVHAHECYLEGLEKTGVEVEQIPRIEDISQKLEKFGWRALPVSGFIPPAAFMELQSLGVLPIASDIRTLDHLLYTPAPDIVHEAAGHAPILVNQEFADYLRAYAQVAKNAIISKEDLDLYEAIRILSDAKENPDSTIQQISEAEKNLEKISKEMSHTSEASLLSRMNWWTAEYGLIGDIKNPKIFGAGLLSSVGESKWCLSDKVKKIPLTVDCVKTTYDITEPQPQLFVAENFQHLKKVLEDLANQMAFRKGGFEGIQKAIQAQSVNTVELDSGVQISGQVVEAICNDKNEIIYLRFQGPSQICYQNKQINGHGKDYHAHGFGTPLGALKNSPEKNLCFYSDDDWEKIGATEKHKIKLEFTSGVTVTGFVKSRVIFDRKTLLLKLINAQAEYNGRILFEPSWGDFDIALGLSVKSVFGGPADREGYGETDDFVAARVPQPTYSDKEKKRHELYAKVRALRGIKNANTQNESELKNIADLIAKEYAEDWLIVLEIYEICLRDYPQSNLKNSLLTTLKTLAEKNKLNIILDGLSLAANIQ